MKVFLVDGTFELFRCFHGAPRHQDADGNEVGAARGFLWTLNALLRNPDVTHIAVAFDQMAGRAQDESASALIRRQYRAATLAARALGVSIWPMVRYQADDALASGAARFKRAAGVEQVVICTTDKDLAQCVESDRVVLLDRIRDRWCDADGVRERWGVSPAQIPDLLGLIGDASDGLPGLPGWGPKSAATLLRRYGDIESIPDDADAWDVKVRNRGKLAATLAARRNEALLVRNLTRLRSDLPLVDTLDDIEWKGAHRSPLRDLTGRWDAQPLLEKVRLWID